MPATATSPTMQDPRVIQMLLSAMQGVGGGQGGLDPNTGRDPLTTEFLAAVQNGTIADFLSKHPELGPEQLMHLYQELDSANQGTVATMPQMPGVTADPRRPQMEGAPGSVGNAPSDRPFTSSSNIDAAQHQLEGVAEGKRTSINQVAQTPYDYVMAYLRNAGKLSEDGTPESETANAERINRALTLFAMYNPQVKGEQTIPKGAVLDMGFVPGKYVWQKGDTIETVAAAHGITAQELSAWLLKNGVDVNSIVPGQPIDLPARPPGTGAGTQGGPSTALTTTGGGEQTQPVTPPTTTNPPPATTPTTPPGGPVTPDTTQSILNLTPQAFMEHLLGTQSMEPSMRSLMVGQSGDYQNIADLLLATGQLNPVTSNVGREDAFRQAMATTPDQLHQAMLSLAGQQPNPGAASYNYLSDPSAQTTMLQELLYKTLGPQMMQSVYSPELASFVQSRVAETGKTATDILKELGWI